MNFELEILTHLDAQVASARRLLDHVLAQGAAIRRRDAEAVLLCLHEIQNEMTRRGALEQARTALLLNAAAALDRPAGEVTLDAICVLLESAAAQTVTERSAELRGLLAEIAREHGINRALMRQELAFLSHLTRLIGGDPEPGYAPPAGAAPRAQSIHRVLDLQA